MEAAIRWSPHSTNDRKRFLLVDIADQSLALHQVDSVDQTHVAHHIVARSTKLPSFAAFDWSKTQESIVALGLSSGSASLIKLYDDGRPSETATTFKIKQQRKCNSIAFSTKDWLAVAVDKTRSDVCLFIYDANRDSTEPVRRLCAAEVVSSVRFFPSQPETVVASTSRAFIRIYDLRDGYSNTNGNAQASTRCVNNIAIDPLDESYFASAGSTDDPSVTVWDRRWMALSTAAGRSTGAVFEFRPVVNTSARTTVWSLKYSGQRRGRLAVCSSNGELKVIDMKAGQIQASHDMDWTGNNAYVPNPYGGPQWTSPRYGGEQVANYPYVSEERITEKACRDPKLPSSRVVAYDWIQDDEGPARQRMLALRSNRQVDVLAAASTRGLASMTARNDLALAMHDITLTEPMKDSVIAKASEGPDTSVAQPEDFGPHHGKALTMPSTKHGDSPTAHLHRLLSTGTICQERCRNGYLFNCTKNMSIVSEDWQLQRLWEIVERFREHASNGGMVHARSNLDLAYIGVRGLWAEDGGRLTDRRPAHGKPGKMRDAIIGLNKSNDLPAFEGERTSFPEHRQLCLTLCGWKFTPDTLEAECNELIDRGLHYQAVVQAVLHGYTHIALNLLRYLIRSKAIPNIGLGALLASDAINAEQREMCLWMAADTEDAALKALLAYLVSGDWRDVMKTPYLHLGYRLALGLKYLNDTELSGFMQSETARAVRNGDLEGILLTGLAGEQAMDLLQCYIARTNDLQTAVLVTAFTHPRYSDDVRWEMWRETYFDQMQRWQCFPQRALFTVQHAKISRLPRTGESLIQSPPKQVTLRCLHCHGNLARRSERPRSSSKGNATRVTGPAANAGTVCPQCGRHMPRCAICQLWLRTPDPQRTRKEDTQVELANVNGDNITNTKQDVKVRKVMEKLLTFCVRCGHGYHAGHAQMWFERHQLCAVSGCECVCLHSS